MTDYKVDTAYLELTQELFDWIASNGYYYDTIKVNGKIIGYVPRKQKEVSEESVARKSIEEGEEYLRSTDYIIIKIYEATILAPDTVESLKSEYSGELAKRVEWRAKINELQEKYGLS